MNVLSMLETSYVDDVTDHKGRVNGLEDASLPVLLQLRSSVAQNRCSTTRRREEQEKRAAAPQTVNGYDFIGK